MQSNQQSSWSTPSEWRSTHYRVNIPPFQAVLLRLCFFFFEHIEAGGKRKKWNHFLASLCRFVWLRAHPSRTHTSFLITSRMQAGFTYGGFLNICFDVSSRRSAAGSFIVFRLCYSCLLALHERFAVLRCTLAHKTFLTLHAWLAHVYYFYPFLLPNLTCMSFPASAPVKLGSLCNLFWNSRCHIRLWKLTQRKLLSNPF